MQVLIVGGGIGGLTLALLLERAGIACRVFEAAPALRPLGVGINILPHGARVLGALGLAPQLSRAGVETSELCAVNRFGQFIFREPRGRHAGYPWPQWSIHRADLHDVLSRSLGSDVLVLGKKLLSLKEKADRVTLRFEDGTTAEGDAAIGCDGIHSVVRKALFPEEGGFVYEGINMWRGVTRCKPFLTGASMVIGGWLEVGKLVVYPIRNAIDAEGRQLVNWVAEIQSPRNVMQDWSLPGRLEDFLPTFASWRFDWLDVPAMMQAAEAIYEYPMVDREPLPHWTRGRITLLGDAAHPMYPRGSNGANQALLDAECLADCFSKTKDIPAALKGYEAQRLRAANEVVLANRSSGPDSILKIVHERTGDRPFGRIEEVMTGTEIRAISDNYKRIAGFESPAPSVSVNGDSRPI
jgi:2-polyprenyl-6-methoxyphenol hydroxylase-like FAD-dependent oxidoreductase